MALTYGADTRTLIRAGALCNSKGELSPMSFRVMLQRQLASYVQRQMYVGMKDTVSAVSVALP